MDYMDPQRLLKLITHSLTQLFVLNKIAAQLLCDHVIVMPGCVLPPQMM